MTTTEHRYETLIGTWRGGHGGYKARCVCGYTPTEKPTPEAAKAAVEAHVIKKERS